MAEGMPVNTGYGEQLGTSSRGVRPIDSEDHLQMLAQASTPTSRLDFLNGVVDKVKGGALELFDAYVKKESDRIAPVNPENSTGNPSDQPGPSTNTSANTQTPSFTAQYKKELMVGGAVVVALVFVALAGRS